MDIKVLDHGYVQLVEIWGSDERIIEAARMSTAKGFQGWEEKCVACNGCGLGAFKTNIDDGYGEVDECPSCGGCGYHEKDSRLLRYLYTHKHMTPFEMAGLIVEVQAPIFVFREWQRHRTQSYNELSARYTELPDICYIPSVERLKAGKQSQTNRQGSQEGFTDDYALYLRSCIEEGSRLAVDRYKALLATGLARELARLVVPVNIYSRMRASANLRNWLQFLELRQHETAQWEIREYANAVASIVRERFPRTYELFKGETDGN